MTFLGIHITRWPDVANRYFKSKGMDIYDPGEIISTISAVYFSVLERESCLGIARMHMFYDIMVWELYVPLKGGTDAP